MDEVLLALLAAVGAAGGGAAWWYARRRIEGDGNESAESHLFPAAASDRIRRALEKGSGSLIAQLASAFRRSDPHDRAIFDDLESILLQADAGSETAMSLVEAIRKSSPEDAGGQALRAALRTEVIARLQRRPAARAMSHPHVILMVGVNGVGETTTIGKLAAFHRAKGRAVLLVAADTFRAAASDQLAEWAARTGSDLIRHRDKGDPSAVVFDGMRAARARGVDVVLVDSAGRLHTRGNLMRELEKMRRVMNREIEGAPHETLLVLDATTGQNALSQAKSFVDQAGATGIVLTKLDGTAKGGVVLAVHAETGLPIEYVGVGEGIEDLAPFDAEEFATVLVGEGAGSPN